MKKSVLFLMTFVVACLISISAYAGINDGLVAHYPFNDDATDASSNGNDGQEYGGVDFSNGYASFDGIDDYIDVPSDPSLAPSEAITVSTWIRSTYTGQSAIMLKWDYVGYPSSGRNYWMTGNQGDYSLAFSVYGEDSSYAQVKCVTSNCPIDVWNGEWHLVTGTYNKSELKLFIDGQFISSVPYTQSLSTSDGTLGFARDMVGHRYEMDLKNVRIYNRALTASEIQELYCEGQNPLECGLVAHYPFDGDAADASDNGNNGLEHGAGVTYDSGVMGQAVNFDGASGIDVIDNPVLNPTTSMSSTLWFRASAPVDNWSIHFLLSKYHWISGENYPGYYIRFDRNPYHCPGEGYILGNSFNIQDERRWTHYCTTYAELDDWNFVASVYDGSNVLMYFNGELVGSKSISGPIIQSDSILNIGYTDRHSSGYFNGMIDEVRIYNRALSQAEILALYQIPTEANIVVDPIEYDFGFVKLLEERTTTVSITNEGRSDLTVNDISLVEYIDGDPTTNSYVEFGLVAPLPTTPLFIPPGESQEILVKYIPKYIYNWASLFHVAEAELVITSDDPDEPEVRVAFSGKGAEEVDIDQSALDFVDEAADLFSAGSIVLGDDGNSGGNKFNALLDEVLTAGGHIAEGNITEACDSLWGAYQHTDGQDKPKDHIFGEGAIILANSIADMMAEQGCSQTPSN